MSPGEMLLVVSDEDLNEYIRLLNKKHREVFNNVYSWLISYMKNLMSQNITIIQPLYLFITGGTGVGKSFLTKILYQFLTKTFSYKNSSFYNPKVFLVAPTSAAAVNIDGTTIHSELYVTVGYFGRYLPGLSYKMKSSLRNKYSELKMLVIDEKSVVSNDFSFKIHLKLVEKLGRQDDKPFFGLTVMTIGNFFQKSPMQARPFYMHYGDTWKKFEPLQRQFKIVELTELMQQQEITSR